MFNVWWSFNNDAKRLSVSYKERLDSLVFKEEFFPLMGEMKEFIRTLTAAGEGIILPGFYIKNLSKIRAVNGWD